MVTSQLDVKNSCNSVSGRSYIASTPETSNVAVFEVSEICVFFVYKHRYTLLSCYHSVLVLYEATSHKEKCEFVLNIRR